MVNQEIIIRVVLLAIVGAIIGYSTNVIAVKMLFRPLKPYKIPVINYELWGLIPKRRDDIAKNIGKAVGEELVDYDKLVDGMIRPEDKEEIKAYINSRVEHIINEKISFIPTMFRPMVLSGIGEVLNEEIDKGMDDVIDKVKDKVKSRIDVGQMVEEKIGELDLVQLEELIMGLSKKELKHIENLGLVLGFLIGIVQGIITIFI